MNETTIRREIAAKRTRVTYLVDLLKQNTPHLSSRIAEGFFTSAADDLRTYAAHCDEIARLNGEIVQMTFELEPRVFQFGLPLGQAAAASA